MLDSLCALEAGESWEVIAVDNGSTDNTQAVLAQYAGRLPLFTLQEPAPGKNRALNRAVEHVRGDLVVLTDDDILADAQWLAALRQAADTHPDYSVFAGRIRPHWQSPPSQLILDHAPLGVTYALTPANQQTGPIFPGLVWGPNMAVRRRVFDAGHRFRVSVGPTAGNYIMGSETEFTIRLAEYGYASWYTEHACVQHIIRPEQTTPEWVIRRAYRFGRNQWIQLGGQGPEPKILGIERWRFTRYVQHTGNYLRARLCRDQRAEFKARWELSFLRGYITQGLDQHFVSRAAPLA